MAPRIRPEDVWLFYLWSQLGAGGGVEGPPRLSTVEQRFELLCGNLRAHPERSVAEHDKHLQHQLHHIQSSSAGGDSEGEDNSDSEDGVVEEAVETAPTGPYKRSLETHKQSVLENINLTRFLRQPTSEPEAYSRKYARKERLYQEQKIVALVLNPAPAVAFQYQLLSALRSVERRPPSAVVFVVALVQVFVQPLRSTELQTLGIWTSDTSGPQCSLHVDGSELHFKQYTEQAEEPRQLVRHSVCTEPWLVEVFKLVLQKGKFPEITRDTVQKFLQYLQTLGLDQVAGESLRRIKHPYVPLRLYWVAARAAARQWSQEPKRQQKTGDLRAHLLHDMFVAQITAAGQLGSQHYNTVEDLTRALVHLEQYDAPRPTRAPWPLHTDMEQLTVDLVKTYNDLLGLPLGGSHARRNKGQPSTSKRAKERRSG
jgi:hypothetical protein